GASLTNHMAGDPKGDLRDLIVSVDDDTFDGRLYLLPACNDAFVDSDFTVRETGRAVPWPRHVLRGSIPPAVWRCGWSVLLPVRMRVLDAQDAYFGGEEAQFVQGEGDAFLVGVSLDLDVEATGIEPRAHLAALDLGEVDAPAGKSAECLVERAGDVAARPGVGHRRAPPLNRRGCRLPITHGGAIKGSGHI